MNEGNRMSKEVIASCLRGILLEVEEDALDRPRARHERERAARWAEARGVILAARALGVDIEDRRVIAGAGGCARCEEE